MLTYLARNAKKLYMPIGSQGNVTKARDELDFHELSEMSHPVFRNIPESKVEPILEIPEKKIHLRLEDTVLITPSGAENMTAGAPAGVEEIYALLRQTALGGSFPLN
jgi:hypothetical protein